MVETVFQADMPFRAKIMAAGHQGEIDQVAGVKLPGFGGALQIQINVFLNPITVAGRADIGAGAAGQTLIPPFLPDIGLELHIKDLGEIGGVDL